MGISLLLLMNCAIFAQCQSTISSRNNDISVYTMFEDMKCEMESIRQLVMDLQQEKKSEIEEIRQIVAQQRYWSRNECPTGFDYLPEVGSCYKVIFERMTWDNATEKCRQIMHGMHLAAITTKNENDAIARYLQSQLSGGNHDCTAIGSPWPEAGNLIWIGGRTTRPGLRCGHSYAWRPLTGIEIPFNYTNWKRNSPDCYRDGENCVHITTGINYSWNDYRCDWLSCAICELHV